MSGRIQVVVDGGLLEDILEVAEGLDGGFVHVGGIRLSSAGASAPAALITLTSGVTVGFVRYMCLKKAAPKMWDARVATTRTSSTDSVWLRCQGRTLFCSAEQTSGACGVGH
jgi:hypothetical protein